MFFGKFLFAQPIIKFSISSDKNRSVVISLSPLDLILASATCHRL